LGIELTRQMVVREIMSSPVLTVDQDQNVVEAAKIMDVGLVGAVIVTGDGEKPVGILTERDIVKRVVSQGLNPVEVKVKEIMSTPLRTVEPEVKIVDAAKMMNQYQIRRLGVVYKGELVGIVTGRDILSVTPELFEIIQERARIELNEELMEQPALTGYCDRCGAYSDNLKDFEGEFLCDDCRLEREEER